VISTPITSPQNAKIKLVRALQTRRRSREAEGAFIVEGVRLVEEAIAVDWPLDFILYDETLSERGLALLHRLELQKQAEIAMIAPNLMAEISDTETPQGILAVLKLKTLPLPEAPTFIVIADQIRDPGNMGTLLRTAEAVGADVVLNSPGTVDAFSPKVLRGGMGAHFHLPIHHLGWEAITAYVDKLPVFLAEAEGDIPLWKIDFRQPCALLVGGEAFGASVEGQKVATQKVTIPMKGRAESLNAAVAAAILMVEILRQRS
jgi:TrmH family RNA methyltransferase